MIGYHPVFKKKKSQTQINREANQELDKIYKEKGLYEICEPRISNNCLHRQIVSYGKTLRMTYAHRHKRIWYKVADRMKLLSKYNQTIRACISCHQIIEHDEELTEEIFNKLRGPEDAE